MMIWLYKMHIQKYSAKAHSTISQRTSPDSMLILLLSCLITLSLARASQSGLVGWVPKLGFSYPPLLRVWASPHKPLLRALLTQTPKHLADSNSDLYRVSYVLFVLRVSFHPAGVVFRPGRWKNYTFLCYFWFLYLLRYLYHVQIYYQSNSTST